LATARLRAEIHHGIAQLPLHGAPLTATLIEPDAPSPRSVQYFEQMGHRGLWADELVGQLAGRNVDGTDAS